MLGDTLYGYERFGSSGYRQSDGTEGSVSENLVLGIVQIGKLPIRIGPGKLDIVFRSAVGR